MDPAVGRFLAPDTAPLNMKDPQSLNRYSYALNNPLKYIDPTGHKSMYNPATQPQQLPPDGYAPPTPSSTPTPVPAPTPAAGDAVGAAYNPGDDTVDAPAASPAPTPSPAYVSGGDDGGGGDLSGPVGVGLTAADAVARGAGLLAGRAGAATRGSAETAGAVAGAGERINRSGPWIAAGTEGVDDVAAVQAGRMTPNQAASRVVMTAEVAVGAGYATDALIGLAVVGFAAVSAPIWVPVLVSVAVVGGVAFASNWLLNDAVFASFPETFGER